MLCQEYETRFECHEVNKSNLYVRRDGVFYYIKYKKSEQREEGMQENILIENLNVTFPKNIFVSGRYERIS